MKTTTKTFRMKKSGIVAGFEVYQASDGNTFVARLVSRNGNPVVNAPWGDPADSEKEATLSAFNTYATPEIKRNQRNAEYYRSGGY